MQQRLCNRAYLKESVSGQFVIQINRFEINLENKITLAGENPIQENLYFAT